MSSKSSIIVRLAFLLWGLSATGAGAQITAIHCGELIDGNGDTPTQGAVVLVEGERIAAVGSRDVVPEGAAVIDLSSATCLPGLIDAHAHPLILRRYVFLGTIDDDRGRLALEQLALLDVDRYAHDLFLPRIWDLRHNVSAYDAAYVALAEALDAPLLTGDRGLATAPGIRAQIELVE